MVINTNISAQSSARLLADSSDKLSKSLARLSSGSKIVSPEDDAAGMAVSMRFDAQVNRVIAANSNVGNAISYSQTQDGFLQKTAKALDRMSELSVLAQDVTKTGSDLSLYDQEFNTLAGYIKDIGTKEVNGVSLFSGQALSVTTDADPTAANKFSMQGISLATLDIYSSMSSLSITTSSSAATALTAVKTAITQLATDRAVVGANIVRLSSTSSQLGVLKDNLAAANSRIKDVDVADESTQFARYNILVQAGTAMLAQANSSPQSALRLLQ
jgi:flagellin